MSVQVNCVSAFDEGDADEDLMRRAGSLACKKTGNSEQGCFRQGKHGAVLNYPCGILTKSMLDILLRLQGTI